MQSYFEHYKLFSIDYSVHFSYILLMVGFKALWMNSNVALDTSEYSSAFTVATSYSTIAFIFRNQMTQYYSSSVKVGL